VKRAVLAGALFSLIALSGCGGAGDTANLPSLYQGNWGGTWSSGAGRDSGTISLVVLMDGSVSGSIARSSGSGSISGFIQKNGKLNAVASFAAGGNMVMGGNVQLTNGRLVGSFSYVMMGVEYAGFFDCSQGGGSGSTGGTGGGTGGGA